MGAGYGMNADEQAMALAQQYVDSLKASDFQKGMAAREQLGRLGYGWVAEQLARARDWIEAQAYLTPLESHLARHLGFSSILRPTVGPATPPLTLEEALQATGWRTPPTRAQLAQGAKLDPANPWVVPDWSFGTMGPTGPTILQQLQGAVTNTASWARVMPAVLIGLVVLLVISIIRGK